MSTTYLINLSLIWLVAWGLYYLLLQQETAFRLSRFYLLISFFVGLTWPWWQSWLPTTSLAEVIRLPMLEPLTVGAVTLHPSTESNWTIWTYLDGIYWLGCGLLALRLLWQLAALLRLIRASERHWQGGVCQVTGPQIHEAGSWFCYLFLPNETIEQLPSEITTHELAHIRQGHSWDVLLLEIAGVFFWWHPLWYAYNRHLRQVHEYLADAAVLRHSSVRRYAQLLVQQAKLKSKLSLVSTFYTSPLKQRIIMMTKKSPRLRMLTKYALVLPLLAFLALACAEAVGSEDIATTEASHALQSQDPMQGDKVYKEVDQMPVFGNCEGVSEEERKSCSQSNLLEYIYTNVKYPKEAFEQALEGIALTEIVITETGKVTQVHSLSAEKGDVSELLNEEALRVISAMPDFQPGRQDGKPVKVRMVLPISFKLQ